jgi:hypothetical protein
VHVNAVRNDIDYELAYLIGVQATIFAEAVTAKASNGRQRLEKQTAI